MPRDPIIPEFTDSFDIDLVTRFPETDGPDGHPPSWFTFLELDGEQLRRAALDWAERGRQVGDQASLVIGGLRSVYAVALTVEMKNAKTVAVTGVEPDLGSWPPRAG